MKLKVLFLCASNGIQSPMAEALLNALDSEHFEAISAGIERDETYPLTVEVMREIGMDLEKRVSKATQDVLDRRFDFVITLCEQARVDCPNLQGAEVVHWQFEDPLAAPDENRQRRLFRSLRDQIAQRIRLFALVQVRFADANAGVHHQPALSV
jgi:protein-tyrosine-phosphatase